MSETRVIFVTSLGLPVEELSPVFTSLQLVSDNSDVTPLPTIAEIGGGFYKFDVDVPLGEVWAGVIDVGDTVAVTSRYIPVVIGTAETDIDIEVYVTPVYDSDSDTIVFCTYMNVKGRIYSSPDSVSISVYDLTHTLLFTVTGTTDVGGVFVVSKVSPAVSEGEGYYVTSTITVGSLEYKSVEAMYVLQ